eukprot:TRINITY_DN3965_c0_g1_i4.p1 TRINITY_DN3965_c0_g1~~TRINITY_DN3965_c0_g1_i4.p1  ORF type:complete len:437 (-),score=83.12 TRINITY_DN3965_c0_g1_i4:78-1388(-)
MPAGDRKSSLLLVLPGRAGRKEVLNRITCDVGPVTVLVPSHLAEYSAWARNLVNGWIEFESSETPSERYEGAWKAISAWLEDPGFGSLSGCMTYDEWGLELCAYLCGPERLNLPFTPLSTVSQIRDKACFRQACRDAGVPAPRFVRAQTFEDLRVALQDGEWQYPLILKPSKGAGSYYCHKARDQEDCLAAFERMDTRFREEGRTPKEDVEAGWLCEEFFEGAEVDVDGWARNGAVEWMLVSDNRPCLEPSCGELGGIYPSQLPRDLIGKLEQLTRDVVSALPGMHSAFHFEALVNTETGRVMPIECNMRVGGAECPTCVEAVTGISLPLAAADLALGRPMRQHGEPRVAVVASTNEMKTTPGLIMACDLGKAGSDADYIGAAFYGVPGSRYSPFDGSRSTLCWLAAGGDTAEEAEKNLNRCVSLCNIVLDTSVVE